MIRSPSGRAAARTPSAPSGAEYSRFARDFHRASRPTARDDAAQGKCRCRRVSRARRAPGPCPAARKRLVAARGEPGEIRMIGRLNHVAIAVPDLAAAAAQYRDTLGATVRRAAGRAGARGDRGLRRAAEHQDRAAAPARRQLADRGLPRQEPRRRHPPHLLRGRGHPRRPRPAARRRARACSATATPKIGAHGKPVLFLHPKDFAGTLVELEQA